MELAIGQVFFEAAVLCIILYLVARHEADYSFAKVAMVTAGIGLGNILLEGLAGPKIGPIFTTILSLVFICVMLVWFCWISPLKSIIVMVSFCTFHLLLVLGVAYLQRSMMESSTPTLVEQRDSDIDEIKKEMERQARMLSGEVPPPPTAAEAADAPVEQPDVSEPPAANKPAVAAAPVAPPPPPPPTEPAKPEPPSQPQTTAPQPPPPPPEPAEPPETPDWIAAKKNLKIVGIVAAGGGKFTAKINNTMVEVGGQVFLEYGGKIYRWRVTSISRDGINFQRVDIQPVPAPAQRKGK